MQGTIKTLKENGFGFIKTEGSDKDIFFHGNNLVGVTFEELREGDTVSFETETAERNGEMKTSAINVQRV